MDAFCTYYQYLHSDDKKDLPSLSASPRESFATPMGLRHWSLMWLAYVNSTHPHGDFPLSLQMCSDIDWDMQMASKHMKRCTITQGSFLYSFKNMYVSSGAMAPWLNALAALAEDLGAQTFM